MKYYQPEKATDSGMLPSFAVYHSRKRCKGDFPGDKILSFENGQIETPRFVDLDAEGILWQPEIVKFLLNEPDAEKVLEFLDINGSMAAYQKVADDYEKMEFSTCCGGFECGCLGMPTDPEYYILQNARSIINKIKAAGLWP